KAGRDDGSSGQLRTVRRNVLRVAVGIARQGDGLVSPGAWTVNLARRRPNEMAAVARTGLAGSYAAFSEWLTSHPLAEDRPFGASSVRYQVARYCDYLDANPWREGDPLRDPAARDGAVKAYGAYLQTFGTPAATIRLGLLSIGHFYRFLGLQATAGTPGSGA